MRALRIEDDNVYRQTLIATGNLVVNLDDKTVVVAGAQVYFTKKEYQVLELLCLRKGTVLTKDMFLKHIYGGVDVRGEKIIDVFMCSVRKKLAYASNGKDYIQTFRGRGYTLRRPTEDDAA